MEFRIPNPKKILAKTASDCWRKQRLELYYYCVSFKQKTPARLMIVKLNLIVIDLETA